MTPGQGVLDYPTGREAAAATHNHPMHDADRARIMAAIEADAHTHAGIVDPGRVREALTGDYGLTVYPRLLSACYSALANSRRIVHHSWTTNTDVKGRNAGRPQRLWQWVA